VQVEPELARLRRRYLELLERLRRVLESRYPDRRDRVSTVCDTLRSSIENLRHSNLADYLLLLYRLSREFPELVELVPTGREVELILRYGRGVR
jgi:hypothetical protein